MDRSAKTRVCTLGLIAITAFGACFGGNDADKAGGEEKANAVVLTLANPGAAADLEEFAREVSTQSHGSMRIDLEDDWREGEMDSERGTIEDVRDGKVDMGSVGARALDRVGVRSLQPLVAPFAVDSYALEREVMASPLAGQMLRGVEQLDLIGITLLPGELRKPLGVSRALIEPSDYSGATIGVRPSNLSARTFQALGASPQGYAVGGDISRFDGVEAGLAGIEGSNYDRPARTLAINVSLWPRVVAIVMNRVAYGALSNDQRDALHEAGRAALDPAIEAIAERDAEAMSVLCNRDRVAIRSASPAQLDAFRAATSQVREALERDPATRDAAREIAAMSARVEGEQTPSCEPDGEPATAERTPVDGLWSMNTTADELAEIASAGDVVPENWGEGTFAFRAGRFAFTEENRDACIWAYGSYTVKGDVVEWIFEDGGGDAPTDAANRPGEEFAFRWSRYRDQLTLEPVEGAISPEPFRVKPWRLLDGEPSLEALSARCPPPADALVP